MRVYILHKNKQYLEECAAVLNEEWSRSKTARIHSLEKSCDKFPINLVLVDDNDVPVGHSRLALVIGKVKSCFVESVVVKKAMRGKGLGKLLMLETEKFAKGEGYTTMYLTTHDKQDFYQHIGYTYCQPVVSCGVNSSILPQNFLDRLAGTSLDEEESEQKSTNKSKTNMTNSSSSTPKECSVSTAPPPPQAPSLPLPPPHAPSLPHPPPLPSIVPAAPKVPSVTSKGNNSDKDLHPEISKWDPQKISWMKKDIF